ncbi:hypothetical protein [Sulfurimonas sp.]
MSKLVQALLGGMFFTFILDFFIFLGIKLHYIDFYKIDLYYNILFADNQNIFIYAFFTLLFGFIITYIDNYKLSIAIIGSLSILALLTLIPPIGHKVGEIIFVQKNINLKDSRHTYIGDIYYDGRDKITFYDYELQKIITLNKKELKQ